VSKSSIQWTLVIFKLLAGVGGGILGFVGLSEFFGRKTDNNRKVLLVSIGLLLIAGCAVLVHVGKPAGIMAVVRNLSVSSPLSWEFISFAAAILVSIVLLVPKKSNKALGKTLGIIAIIVALAVGFTTGYSHIAMVGMRSWHNPIIPACFLTSALLLGGLVCAAISGKENPEKDRKLFTTIIITLAVLATISYCVYGFTTNLGDYALIYWSATPLLGGALCVASAIMMKIKDSALWLSIAVGSALVGSVVFRALIWSIVETGLRTGNSIVHI